MIKNFYQIAVLGAECSGKSTFLRKCLSTPTFFLDFLKDLSTPLSTTLMTQESAENLNSLKGALENSLKNKNSKICSHVIFEGVRRFVYQYSRAPINHQEQYQLACDYLHLSLNLNLGSITKKYPKNHDQNIVNIVFSDTTPLLTAIYSDYYLIKNKAALDIKDMRLWHLAMNLHQNYDLVLIFSPNIPWVADRSLIQKDEGNKAIPMRDGQDARAAVFGELLKTLDTFKISYIPIPIPIPIPIASL